MSIINFSPHSQYLHSPSSMIHIIKLRYKIFFTCVYLLLIPFKPKIIFLSIFIIYYIFSVLLKYIKLKSQYKNKVIKQILLYTIVVILLIFSYKNIFNSNYKCIKIYYPSLLKYNLLGNITWKFYSIPHIIIKSFFLLYISMHLLNTLFYTTKLEEIMLFFLYIINNPEKVHNLFNILYLFSCSLSTQFLYDISNQVENSFISLKIRKSHYRHKIYTIYFYYFISFINRIISNINNITYTLYIRELRSIHFYLISI